MPWLKECGFGVLPSVPKETERGKLSSVTIGHFEAGVCADSVGRAVAVPTET